MSFPLLIFALDREIFVGRAKSVSLPSEMGRIQILPGHAPLMSLLEDGDVLIEEDGGRGERKKIPIAGGVLWVKPEETVALVSF